MIGELDDIPLVEAVRQAMNQAEGAIALAVMRKSEPDLIVGARRGSPLVVGRGDGENFLASDIPAFLEHTRQMVIIDDDRVVEIRPDVGRPHRSRRERDRAASIASRVGLRGCEKGGYPTFMLKEILEQPHAIADTLAGRVSEGGRVVLDELDMDPSSCVRSTRCSSSHAGRPITRR